VTQFTSPDGTNVYTYNSRDELTGTDSNYQTDEAYSYDASGNRTNAGYQTGANNRLLSDGTYSYTYDNEGNRTSRTNIATGEVTSYSWDYHNRLTDVTTKDINGTLIKAVGYTYDVYNQRISKSVDSDGTGAAAPQTEWYVYDGSNISLVFDGQGNQTHRYLYGTEVDQILADETQTGVNWALVDNLGSVRDIVNNNGTLLNHISYDSFGQVSAQTNTAIDFRYGYTGRELDKETGLDYYRARYYDTTTGGFLSEDPMGFAAGDYNLSRYVFGSPTNFTDPSGLETGLLERTAPAVGEAAAGVAEVTRGPLAKFGPTGVGIGLGLKIIDGGGTVVDPIWKKNQEKIPRPNPGPSPTPSPSPSPLPLPDPTPQPDPNCEKKKKKPCSGQTLGGTYNQVKYSNRNTGSTPHHMPGFAAIKASGIALGQNKSYYYSKTPTACMSSVDHDFTDSNKYTATSIAYVQRVSAIIKTQGFYDAQLEDVKEIKGKFPGIYDKEIAQMQNYTLNLIATESYLFK
jgi:RHS repeat-associated protein